jgi:ADP-ribose pyrophosphatase YjhB (NUDIX family)
MRNKTHCHYCGNRLTKKPWEGRNRLFCDACDLPVYENPIPAACMVTIDDTERVLLVKRSVDPKKGFWCLPGGFMELDETPEGAGLRELREETGLTGQIDMLLGVLTHPSRNYDTILMTGFLVRSFTGEPVAGDDADAVAWFPLGHLPEIAFESHRQFIKLYVTAYAHTGPSGS